MGLYSSMKCYMRVRWHLYFNTFFRNKNDVCYHKLFLDILMCFVIFVAQCCSDVAWCMLIYSIYWKRESQAWAGPTRSILFGLNTHCRHRVWWCMDTNALSMDFGSGFCRFLIYLLFLFSVKIACFLITSYFLIIWRFCHLCSASFDQK